MINYFANDRRSTPINLTAGRFLITCLMLWKLIQYEWEPLASWPSPIRDWLPIFRHHVLLGNIDLIVLICGCFLISVLIGYHIRITAFCSAVLLSYLGAVRHAFQLSHPSRILFTGTLILILYAVFAEEDKITVDRLRLTRKLPMENLAAHLEEERGTYSHRALKWTLIIIGFFYFQAGLSKLKYDPISWIAPANLSRYVLFGSGGFFGDLIIQYPTLSMLGAIGTIILEIGFLLAIISRIAIWPFFIGVAGMHLVILFSVGPDFSDQLVILAMFLPWDRGLNHLQRNKSLTVVYDRHCFLCARSLHLFRYLDIAGNVSYYNQYNIPDDIDTEEIDFDDAMYVFKDDTSFRGYFAFVELFNHLGSLRPISLVMRIPGIKRIGQMTYQHVAANRSRYFECAVPDD